MIINQEIYLSNPRTFNDPFDRPQITFEGSDSEIGSIVDQAVNNLRHKSGKELSPAERVLAKGRAQRRHRSTNFRETFNESVPDTFCALCLSEENNINTMWSHYADKHKGICLGLQLDKLKPNFQHFFRMNYQDTRPDVSIFDAGDPLKFLSAFNTKHSDWAYEKEVRVVNFHAEKLVSFNKSLISSIYLGAEIPNDDKEFVVELVKKYMPHINIFFSKVDDQSLSVSFELIHA